MKTKYTQKYYICLVLISMLLSTVLLAQRSRFEGTWRTTQGNMDISIDGRRVTASYAGGGEINGRLSVDGTVLAGSWTKNEDTGRVLLRMLPNAQGFSGRWWHAAQGTSGEWIGVNAANDLESRDSRAQNLSGSWLTNYGRMVLEVNGTNVSGTFKGLFNSGTIRGVWEDDGKRFVADWSDGKHKGTVILKILTGNRSMKGEWWYDDHEYGGFWYGVRPAALSGCVSGDCDDGRGKYLWSDGTRYEGDWVNGVYHGNGRHYNELGNIINSGYWEQGVYIGKCLSGDCTEGTGKMRMFNRDIYEGPFVEGEAEGTGKYTFVNGDFYEGEFKSGHFSQNGYIEWVSTGESYTGQFFRGAIQGRGSYVSSDKTVYEGLFRKGKRHGEGKLTWPGGDYYEGEWNRDVMEGKGRYRFRHGDEYVGAFKANMRQNKGTYTFADGKAIEASWIEDRVESSDGNSGYEGIAANTDTGGGLSAMLPTRDPGATRGVSTADMGMLYLCSYPEITEYPSTEDAEGYKEVRLNYYLLEGSDTLSVEGAEQYIRELKSIPESAELKVERVKTGAQSLIKRVFTRYRLVGSEVRLNPIAHEYIYMNQ